MREKVQKLSKMPDFSLKNKFYGVLCMFALKGKKVFAVLAVIAVLELALSVFLCVKQLGQRQASLIDYTIVIDAGHGGIDGGVVAPTGETEANLNLAYSQTLGKLFEQGGFNVVYTRKTQNGLYGLPTKGFKGRDMKARKEIIEQARADIVISVHMNKFTSSQRKGPQVFYQTGENDGKALADSLQKVFNDFVGVAREPLAGDYYMCREIDCPSVIVECGFLSNPEDAANLITDSYKEKICEQIFNGVMLYLYSK